MVVVIALVTPNTHHTVFGREYVLNALRLLAY